MSENINFIPATELPVAEGDEVSVLCIENGELKLKPVAKADDNSKYDIVVRVTYGYDSENNSFDLETCEIVSGSFDAVVQKLDAGVKPLGLVIESGQIWDGQETKSVIDFVPTWSKYPDTPAVIFISGHFGILLFEDGTAEID